MAKIGILYGDDNKKGGIRAYSHLLGGKLREIGHRVSYISFASLHSPFYKSPTSGWREAYLTYQLGHYADYISHSFDLIIGNGYYGAFCTHSPLTIYHFVYPSYVYHLNENPLKGIVGGLLEKKAGKHRLRISVSRFLAQELKKFYGFSSIVIPNGIDISVFHPIDNQEKEKLRKKWNIPTEKTVITFVGRWNKRKGADVVKFIAEKMPHVQFIAVVGYGSIKNDNLPNIKALQSLNHTEINEIYNISDLVLYPSRYEPFGYVTAESWASGTPVITTAMGLGYELKGIPTFQPFIVENMDNLPEEVYSRVKWYLSINRDERKAIAEEGSTFIRREYNIEKWFASIYEVITYVLTQT